MNGYRFQCLIHGDTNTECKPCNDDIRSKLAKAEAKAEVLQKKYDYAQEEGSRLIGELDRVKANVLVIRIALTKHMDAMLNHNCNEAIRLQKTEPNWWDLRCIGRKALSDTEEQ